MALQWTHHPILSVPSKDEQIAMGPERLVEYYERREAAIEREKEDPFNFGTELPHWDLADQQLRDHGELLILGGNRSGVGGGEETCLSPSGQKVKQNMQPSGSSNHWSQTLAQSSGASRQIRKTQSPINRLRFTGICQMSTRTLAVPVPTMSRTQ